ncbi:hypothetical protein ACJMK2_008849 [Sinanodonta woodiana]|uniref:Uncharacterized protein n=1 Tax=Sinanodonta woodiana TaxID=1069815 RepID=A0ABD3VC88_SINWO
MYKKRASARQLKQWIVKHIINTDNTFLRKKGKQSRALKVIRHISGPGGDGTIIKHCTDGEVFIRTWFTAEAMRSFFADLDDADSQLDWGNALLILQDYNIHLQDKEYVLQVHYFRLWDLQEGFRRKNTLIHCMQDHKVYKKMLEEEEFQRKEQEPVARADNSLEESLRLTQLLEEIGQASEESPVSVGPSGESTSRTTGLPQIKEQKTTDDVPMLPSGETAGINDTKRCLKELLVAPFDVQEFLISTQESEQLKNIIEWRDDHCPSSFLCEAISSENHDVAISMKTMAEEERKRKEQDSGIQEREAIFSKRSVLVTCQKMPDVQSFISQSPKTASSKNIPTSSKRTAQKMKDEVESTDRLKLNASSQTSSNQKIMTGSDSGPKELDQSETLETSIWQNEMESVRLSCSESFLESQDHQHSPHLETNSIHRDSVLASPPAHSTQREPLGCKDNFSWNSLQENLSPVPLYQIDRETSALNTDKITLTGNADKITLTGNADKITLTGNTDKITSLTGNTDKTTLTGNAGKITLTGNTYKITLTENSDKITSVTGNTDEFQPIVSNEHRKSLRSPCYHQADMTLRRSSRLGKDVACKTQHLADKMSLDKNVVQHKSVSIKPSYYNSSVHSDAEQRINIIEMDDKHFNLGVDFETQTADCSNLVNEAALTAEQNTSGDSIPATLPFQPNIYPETQPFNPTLSPDIYIGKDKLEEERLSSLAANNLSCSKEQTVVNGDHVSFAYSERVAHKEKRSSFETKTYCATLLSKLKSSVLQNGNEPVNKSRKYHERESLRQEKKDVINEERQENERLISLARLDFDGDKRFSDFNDNLLTVSSSKIEPNNNIDLSSDGKQLQENVAVVARECDINNGNLSTSVTKIVPKLNCNRSEGIHVGHMDQIHSTRTPSQTVKRKLVLDTNEEKKLLQVQKKVKTDRLGTAKTVFVNDSLVKGDNLPGPGNSSNTSKSNIKGYDSAVLEKSSQTDVISTDHKYMWDTGKTRTCTFMKSSKNKETDNRSVEDFENSLSSGRSQKRTSFENNVMLGSVENGMVKGDSNLQRETMQNAGETLLSKTNCASSSDGSSCRKELVRRWVAGTLRFVWEKGKSHDKVLDGALSREGPKNQGNSVDHDKELDKIETRCIHYGKTHGDNLCVKVKSDSTHILKQGLEATVKPISSVAVKPKSSLTVKYKSSLTVKPISSLTVKPRSYVAGDGKDTLKEDTAKNSIDDFVEHLSTNLSLPTQTDRQTVKIISQERISKSHQKKVCEMDAILRELEPSEVSDIGKQLLHLLFPDDIRTAAVHYLLEET